MIERQREQAKRKRTRDNEKRAMEKQELLTEEDFARKLSKNQSIRGKNIDTKSNWEKKLEGLKGAPVEKLKVQIEKIENRILNTNFQLKDKEDNSQRFHLERLSWNYIDPRLDGYVLRKKLNVPIESFYQTLRENTYMGHWVSRRELEILAY